MNSELIYPIIGEVLLTEVCMNILVSQNNVLNKYGYDHIDLVYKGSWLSFFFMTLGSYQGRVLKWKVLSLDIRNRDHQRILQ